MTGSYQFRCKNPTDAMAYLTSKFPHGSWTLDGCDIVIERVSDAIMCRMQGDFCRIEYVARHASPAAVQA